MEITHTHRCAEILSHLLRQSAYKKRLYKFCYKADFKASPNEIKAFKKIWKESSFAYLLPNMRGSQFLFSRDFLQTARESDIRITIMLGRMIYEQTRSLHLVLNKYKEGYTADSCLYYAWKEGMLPGPGINRDIGVSEKFLSIIPEALQALPWHKVYFSEHFSKHDSTKRKTTTLTLIKRIPHAL